ncbi:uncharacterized protein BKA55DRAFT_541489 [Fusarium redolens]|uniref:Uncharacterized protein n=1 Tax=Fusarium redolens TaxID=48865 RepID=A0A9P9GRZ3_FUSRE|nr:uncharacterized protein BKA55DRAFT_541489 [Fusarium redolens]KAH7244593.1 hypothetical protein BKA55DRAFT_541489 [Fusarium redolens]
MDALEELEKYGFEGSEDGFYARDNDNNDNDKPEPFGDYDKLRKTKASIGSSLDVRPVRNWADDSNNRWNKGMKFMMFMDKLRLRGHIVARVALSTAKDDLFGFTADMQTSAVSSATMQPDTPPYLLASAA